MSTPPARRNWRAVAASMPRRRRGRSRQPPLFPHGPLPPGRLFSRALHYAS